MYVYIYICIYVYIYIYTDVYRIPLFLLVLITCTKFLNKKGHELQRRVDYDTGLKVPAQHPPEPKADIAVARAGRQGRQPSALWARKGWSV